MILQNLVNGKSGRYMTMKSPPLACLSMATSTIEACVIDWTTNRIQSTKRGTVPVLVILLEIMGYDANSR